MSGSGYSRTRALRSRTVDLEERANLSKNGTDSPALTRPNVDDASEDIESALSDPPDTLDDVGSFGIISRSQSSQMQDIVNVEPNAQLDDGGAFTDSEHDMGKDVDETARQEPASDSEIDELVSAVINYTENAVDEVGFERIPKDRQEDATEDSDPGRVEVPPTVETEDTAQSPQLEVAAELEEYWPVLADATPDTDAAVTADEAGDQDAEIREDEDPEDPEDEPYEEDSPDEVEPEDEFVDAEDIIIDPALIQAQESSATGGRVLRTRSSALQGHSDVASQMLHVPSLRSRELWSTAHVTSHPVGGSAAPSPRRRGRPRIHPVGESRSRRTDRRRFGDVGSEYTSNVSDAEPSVSRSHSASAVDSRLVNRQRRHNQLTFKRTGQDSNKLIVFERSRSSLIARFNLVQLANHVDIHKDNLGISGYLTYDHSHKNIYSYPKNASTFVNNEDNDKEKPYGGILSASQADTARTVPGSFDRMIFGKTLLLAQQQETQIETRKRKRTQAANKRKHKRRRLHESSSEDEYTDDGFVVARDRPLHGTPLSSPSSLSSSSSSSGFSADAEFSDDSSASTAFSDEDVEEDSDGELLAGASKIRAIRFSKYEIETWYTAPYPEEYNRRSLLYICEFCLKYMPSEYVNWRHQIKCPMRHPPGDEIYRAGRVSIFEVDGRKNPMYCQNLCLLAKLFLGSKTLYYDVEPFLFYIMTETDEHGCHFVGYFSKEKRNTSSYNVSCILTLPIHQRKGYGNFLISFSYLLTRTEGKIGTPEKPLSDLGLLSYRNYWKHTLCYELRDLFTHPGQGAEGIKKASIMELSSRTGMTPDDVICGLEALNALVRDQETGTYAVRVDRALIERHIAHWEAKGYINLEPDKLIWTSMVVGKSGGINSLFFAAAGVQPTVSPVAAAEQSQRVESVAAQKAAHAGSTNQSGVADSVGTNAADAADGKGISRQQIPIELPEIPKTRYEIVTPQILAGVPRSRLWNLPHRLENERALDQRRQQIDYSSSASVEPGDERTVFMPQQDAEPQNAPVETPRRRGRPRRDISVTPSSATRSTRSSGQPVFAGELPPRRYQRRAASSVTQEDHAYDEMSPDLTPRRGGGSEYVTIETIRTTRKRREVSPLQDGLLSGRRSLRERH
ncbi:hypothetical protein V1519DRAFT_172011 [Lipomyces tetrasporus]